jgi:hypothetical protein
MGKRFGISITDDGKFVEAAVRVKRHEIKISSVRRWDSHSFLKNYFLLSRAIVLGLPAHWIRQLPDDSEGLAAGSVPSSFSICTSQTEFDHYSETLRNNIVAIYPDDAFLATIPRYFVNAAPNSFVSIAVISGVVKIGIVLKNTLVAVFNVKASTHAELEGHLGRIERYLRFNGTELPVLDTHYLLTEVGCYDPSAGTATKVSCGNDDIDVIKAVGCALCDDSTVVPRFCGPTPANRFRLLRSAIIICAIAVTAFTGLAITALYGYNTKCATRIADAKQAYSHILLNNTEIKDLVTEGDSISRKMIRVHTRLSRPTNWAPFLDQLGTLRPTGLFIERLGSEPADDGSSKTRIALGGWCESETIATDFIKSLKKSPLLTGVTLSSIERIKEPATSCRFKIICVLSLQNH